MLVDFVSETVVNKGKRKKKLQRKVFQAVKLEKGKGRGRERGKTCLEQVRFKLQQTRRA